jgi:hypothetical protein
MATVIFRNFSLRKDTALPNCFLFVPPFYAVDCDNEWLEIRGCINQLRSDMPTDFRIRVPPLVTNFA